jgi:hypothetical protein
VASYQVLVTNMAGVPYGEIANVAVQSITWELNGWGEATMTIPVTDAQAWEHFRPSYQTREEVQIWRNGTLIWWGIYVAATADEQTLTITCYGLLWYFSRRFFGPVHSNTMPALLTNGTMDATPVTTGWTTVNVVATASASRRRTGSQAMKLVTASAANVECFAYQSVNVPTPARTRPLTMTLSAWQYMETLTIPHPANLAMVIGPPGTTALIGTRVEPDDPLGRWVYREATYIVPAGTAGTLSAVLYAPSTGTVYWDDARVTYEQMTGAFEGEDWSDAYLRRIVDYGAGLSGGGTEGTPVVWGAPVLKSTLGMTWTGSGLAAGALRSDLWWNHADEAVIWQAMAELVTRNVLDFEITWPSDGRSRTFTTYPPRKGTTKAGLAAEGGRNIIAWRYDVDGRRLSNDVRVVARSPGKVREVGQAGGPTVVTGPQLEHVINPAFEISGQPLIDQATVEVARLSEPVRVPQITVAAAIYMGDTSEAGAPLTVGDSIPVRIDSGWVQEAATRRVIKMTLHPENETLDLVFNDG